MATAPDKGQHIRDISPGGEVRGLFLLGAASVQQARNGPFWRLELRDATGALEARIWNPLSQSYTDLVAGQFVDIEGRADIFREQIQISVSRLRALEPEECREIAVRDFLLSSRRPPRDMLEDIEDMCRKVLRHKPWRALLRAVLTDADIRPRLLLAPAATVIHHAWVGGLLEHMLGVADLCMALADRYSGLDRQILLAGALVHDLGKLRELSGGLINEYTDEGRLIGHINLGLDMLAPFIRDSGLEPELAVHLRHLVISHHGLPEYGSAREPMTAEAFALHHADNADARMVQVFGLFGAEEPEQGVWSPYQASLKRAVFHARHTPEASAPVGGEPEKEHGPAGTRPGTRQCSLL
jgi:3'-5' exoribonuclease